MKTKIQILFLLIFCILVFSRCKKMYPGTYKNLGTLKFTEAELDVVPYKTGDTIVFRDSIGDSLTMVVTSRSSQFYKYHEYENTATLEYSGDIYTYENNSTLFNNGDKIILNFANPFKYDGKVFRFFTIDFSGGSGFYEQYDFNSSLLFPSTFHDSLLILNKKYYSVYELKKYKLSNDDNSLLFYTFKEGIVGFKTNDGKYWYLK